MYVVMFIAGALVAVLAGWLLAPRFRAAGNTQPAGAGQSDSEFRFQGTFDNAAVGMAHVGIDGRFLRVNQAFLAITGFERSALEGRSFADITLPADLEADVAQARALASGDIRSYAIEKRYVRPDGSHVWVNLTVGLQRDVQGQPLFYISVIEDTTARRATEKALRESEARFRDIADATPVLIWISDTTKTCTWFNSRWLQFTGRTLAEETGYGWVGGIHPDDHDRCVKVYEQAFERREAYRTEYRRRRVDGAWRILDASGVPRYEDGAFVGFIGSCIDITEQRAASRSLVRREEQLRLATEAAEVGLWDVDLKSNAMFWTPRVKAMFGISAQATVTLDDFYAGLHPEDHAATASAFEAATDPDRRALYDVEYRTIGKEDGKIRWVSAKGRGLFRDRTCTRVLGTALDVSGRKHVESQLRSLNEGLEQRVQAALAERTRYIDILEATDEGVLLVDTTWRVVAFNRAMAGHARNAYGTALTAGDSLREMLPPESVRGSRLRPLWDRALAGEQFTATCTLGEEVGDARSYQFSFNLLKGADGSTLGAFHFLSDVTEHQLHEHLLAEAEKRLMQTQKMDAIGQLTGGIAHDFNNLLMVISGGLGLMQRSVEDAHRLRMIERMQQATERGAALTRQLLGFARRQPVKAEPTDLRRRLDSMREILDRALREDVVIATDLPVNLWPVTVDSAELELALLNLCVNARDAMPAGGVITMSADNAPGFQGEGLSGDYVTVRVSDTGTGIPPDILARVFEPFFTTKEVGKGSGLGLAQVYAFAQQSGGAVSIDSKVGTGTTVSLHLPRSAVKPQEPALSQTTDSVIRRVTEGCMLVVEDNDEVAAQVTEMLTVLGFRSIRAASAQAALGALADHPEVTFVFSDVVMPGGLTGVDLALEIRRRKPALPILLTTGYAGNALKQAAGEGFEVLPKPYTLEALQAAVHAAMAGRPEPSTRRQSSL